MVSRAPRLVTKLALALAGLVLGLLLAEGLARLVQPAGTAHLVFNAADAEPDGLYRIDKRVGLELVPGFEGVYAIPGARVDLRVNQLGMRGPEPADPPAPRRWLVLGDSFTLALQVPEEQLFLTLLGERLGIELHNGGVAGDCTWQSAMRWKRWSPRIDPDTVLLVYFVGNDLTDNEAFERWRIDGPVHPGPQPVMPAKAQQPWPLRLLRERSFLFAQAQVLIRQRQLAGSSDQPLRMSQWQRELEAHGAEAQQVITRSLSANREALAWLKRLCDEADQRLVVALAPPLIAIDQRRLAPTFELAGLSPQGADPHAPTRAIEALLAELDIPSCDLTPALEASQAAGEDPYLVYDGHWSARGHQVVADALQACLTELEP
jgi:lysophospholipase L1-like esterase